MTCVVGLDVIREFRTIGSLAKELNSQANSGLC